MAQLDVSIGLSISRNAVREGVLASLYLVRSVVLEILGIKVPVNNMVPKIGRIVKAAGDSVAGSVRGTEVLGEEPEDIAEGHLVVDYLLLTDLVT